MSLPSEGPTVSRASGTPTSKAPYAGRKPETNGRPTAWALFGERVPGRRRRHALDGLAQPCARVGGLCRSLWLTGLLKILVCSICAGGIEVKEGSKLVKDAIPLSPNMQRTRQKMITEDAHNDMLPLSHLFAEF